MVATLTNFHVFKPSKLIKKYIYFVFEPLELTKNPKNADGFMHLKCLQL